ncbi:MAG: Hsp70 family protein, partial [Mycobacteriaceae bacterium]|nr:Hsp70 family protein [Mycobacteriaceae bacterium]
MSGWVLGVDFGTTTTVAAQLDPMAGAAQPLILSQHGAAMPSAVFVETASRIAVGEHALGCAHLDPSRFYAAPKRLVALTQTTIQVGVEQVPATVIVAAVLRSALAAAQTARGGSQPAGIVLTHPVNWSADQIQVLLDAAQQVGYPAHLVRAVPEPLACAQHWARTGVIRPDQPVLVVDIGGGATTAAALRPNPHGSFDIAAAHSEAALSGRSFDAAVRRWAEDQLSSRNPRLLAALREPAAVRESRALDDAVRTAKETLSATSETTVDIAADGRRETLTLTRPELEGLVDADVRRIVEAARAAAPQAGPRPVICLTGGSSR